MPPQILQMIAQRLGFCYTTFVRSRRLVIILQPVLAIAEQKATELALFAGDIAKYGRVKAKNNLKD